MDSHKNYKPILCARCDQPISWAWGFTDTGQKFGYLKCQGCEGDQDE